MKVITYSISLIALMALVVAGCERGSGGQLKMPARPPAQVVVTPAIARDVPIYIDQIGRATAREAVMIQPQISGKITDLHFVDGAEVKKGDLLFTIDARPFQAALAAAQATLAEDRAKLKFA